MRPIDGDKLIEEANKDGAYGYVSVKEIADGPTIEPYGTWIPVTERLPGYKLCLITQKVGTQKVRKVALRVLGEWKFNGRKIKDEAVIAWMPLPKPYREEKKDEKDS